MILTQEEKEAFVKLLDEVRPSLCVYPSYTIVGTKENIEKIKAMLNSEELKKFEFVESANVFNKIFNNNIYVIPLADKTILVKRE